MGSVSSMFRRHDEDDVLGVEYDSQGVIKRIPIEVKPRGKLGLRSVGSFGRKPKGGSLRSALSMELEDPEVHKIRKDFEMYRLNKENEIVSMQKKERKFETENKRLRAELQALQKTCKKLRDERDAAQEAERQALIRASAFESDRDKIQRQFKLFRETKEGEIQGLLHARRDLEGKLNRLGHAILSEDSESRMGIENAISGNPGDWWAALESEPSLGSTTQLHTPAYKGLEFAHSMVDLDGPFTNVNKEDWNTAAASLAQIMPNISETVVSNIIRLYISAPWDVQEEVSVFMKHCDNMRALCLSEGRILLIVHMPLKKDAEISTQMMDHQIHGRCKQVDMSTIFLAFFDQNTDRFTQTEYRMGHLNDPGSKSAVFCFKNIAEKSPKHEVCDLKARVRGSRGAKIIDSYISPEDGANLAYEEIDKILRHELNIDKKTDESLTDIEEPEHLCGGGLWDPYHDIEELESLRSARRSTCELGFEKYYEKLNAHVSAPGPLPPLLISGAPGSGKSLLLAKWIELEQQKSSGSLVLYHFVESNTSCITDPVVMMRRLTSQLMQQASSVPALTCDPQRITDEFPRWLEKISSKTPGGVLLVLDSIDRFQNALLQLKWLLDPLPVDLQVVVSVDDRTCPAQWRAWPELHIDPLSNKCVKELLRAELSSIGCSITAEQENRIIQHCNTPATCLPLYIVVLISDVAKCSSAEQVDQRLDTLLSTADTLELYKALLDLIRHEYDVGESRGLMKQIMKCILSSRNGLSETELFSIISGMSWNYWAPIFSALSERHILKYRAGLLVFSHQEAREAVRQRFMNDTKAMNQTREIIRDYFFQNLSPDKATYRVTDELPWLCRQMHDKQSLQNCLQSLCVFLKLYGRGRSGELISYWQYLGGDKQQLSQVYFDAAKSMESMVGQFGGFVTFEKIANVYEALGRFLRDLGLLEEALAPLQKSLEIREMALDSDHPSVAQSLHQLATLHAQWNKFTTAEALYKQALEIYEATFGRDHYLVAKELESLSVLYRRQDKHEMAEPLRRRALSIGRKSKPVKGSPMRTVDPLRRRVLQLEELAMGPDSSDLARTLNELGVLYYLQNNVDTAESFFQRSLEMRESVLGNGHPDISQSLNNLAGLYMDRKQYDKAEPLYERALRIRQRHFSPDHPSVATIVKHLALLYKRMGKLDKAEPLYRQAIKIRERTFGHEHPSVATAKVNLAVLHSEQGNHVAALPLYEQALKIYEECFGPTHPRVAETLRNLALLKYDQGAYEEAAKLYKRSTEIKETDPSLLPSKRSSIADGQATLTGKYLLEGTAIA